VPDRTTATDPRDAWTHTYLRGLEAPAIAKLHRAPRDTVQRHLANLLDRDPGLWERRLLAHDRPAPPWHGTGSASRTWRTWCERLRDFTARTGALPRAHRDGGHVPADEALMRLWLEAQRTAHRRGTLTLTQHTALAGIPDWHGRPTTATIPGRPIP
jgi:hypothetical protein